MKGLLFHKPFPKLWKPERWNWRKNGVYLLFCLVLFSGVVFGAVSGRSADPILMQRLDIIFLTNFELRCTEGMGAVFIASFASSVIFLGAACLLGLSLWGGIFTAAIPFFKGYGYGLSVGYLYGAYGFKGILYNLIVILPGMFLASAVIALAARHALRNSIGITGCFRRTPVKDDPRELLRRYFLVMLRCLLGCALASLMDMLCALCFSWLFSF